MVFEGVVENTISEYQIGPKTLATRVGGIIGVGKNLLWILIFALTSLGTFLTYSRTFMKIKWELRNYFIKQKIQSQLN